MKTPAIRAAMLAAAVLTIAAAPPPGATNCSGCHAAGSGNAVIAGRPADDLVASMTAFRSGAMPSTIMGRLTKGLNPAEIEAIAAWISAQK